MNRNSGLSSTGSLATPVTTGTWGPSRLVSPQTTLYMRALKVINQLKRLDGMEPFFALANKPASELPALFRSHLDVVPPNQELDAVSLLLRLFRMGGPLTLVYNHLHPNQPLTMISIEDALDTRAVKRSIYHFISASTHELDVKMIGDHFMVTQVFGSAASDVLRPLRIVEVLLERLEPSNVKLSHSVRSRSRSSDSASSNSGQSTASSSDESDLASPTAPIIPLKPNVTSKTDEDLLTELPTKLHKVLDELLQTERKYVQDLEVLLQFHDEMLQIGLPRETVNVICPQLVRLVDFQRRLLIGLEYQLQLPLMEQDIGWLFRHLLLGFEVYKSYTIGQKEAVQTAIAEGSALAPLSHILEPMYELPSTLLKPVQRILRYPMLLREIRKQTPESWPVFHSLQSALDAMLELTMEINETQRKAENSSVVSELQDKVRDWKNLDYSLLGELLLSGVHPVSNHSEVEQEYHLYAFERCVVFFRDRAALRKTPLQKMRPLNTARNSQIKSVYLELRGRVYIKFITKLQITKQSNAGYVLRVVWGHLNEATEHGYIDIRLQSEEVAQQWEQTLLKQRNKLTENLGQNASANQPLANDQTGFEPVWDPNLTQGFSARSSRSGSVSSMNVRGSQISLSASRPVPKRSSSSSIATQNGAMNGAHRSSSVSNSTNPTSHSSYSSGGSPYGYQPNAPYPIQTSFLGPATNTPNSAAHTARKSNSNQDISLPEDVMPGQFWSDHHFSTSTHPMEALRKMSVGSYTSQHSTAMSSTTSIPSTNSESRSSLVLAPNSQGSSSHTRPNLSHSSSSSLNVNGQRKVRVHMESDTFLLLISPDTPFDNLVSRVQRKLRLCGKLEKIDPELGLRFQYVDEDEDLVGLESDDDMLMAFESVPESDELCIYVNI